MKNKRAAVRAKEKWHRIKKLCNINSSSRSKPTNNQMREDQHPKKRIHLIHTNNYNKAGFRAANVRSLKCNRRWRILCVWYTSKQQKDMAKN